MAREFTKRCAEAGENTMSEALISPSVLAWARRRRDLDAADLARKLNVKPEKVKAWESGDGLPTFRQAQRAAVTVPETVGEK